MADPKVTREHRERAVSLLCNYDDDKARRWAETGDGKDAGEFFMGSAAVAVSRYLATLEAEALERGRREERGSILTLVRFCADRVPEHRDALISLVNAIERGDHLKGGESG